jgi:hypothetical protein
MNDMTGLAEGMTAIFWLLALICLVTVLFLRRLRTRRTAQVATWQQTPGRIVGSVVRGYGVGKYVPEISYAFEIEGRGYASDALRPGGTPFFFAQARAQAVVAYYQSGQTATVYYDPLDPERCALEPVSYQMPIAPFFVFGTCMALCGFVPLLALSPY